MILLNVDNIWLESLQVPVKNALSPYFSGNSIFRIDSIFIGPGEIPVEHHLYLKNDTYVYLNCSFSLFKQNLFSSL